jgi:hypothetical protein
MLTSMLSMSAIFLLPRQVPHHHYRKQKRKSFENCHLGVSFISIDFQFFCFPIAWGGKILFLGKM